MSGRKATRYAFEPDYAVPPGETLKETIDAIGMSQRDLAIRTGMSPKTINEIIKGKAPITPDTAILLERVTRVPAGMWNNLEKNYRAQLSKIADRERLGENIKWLATIPVRELIKRGYIENTKDELTLVNSALQFFSVAGSEQWNGYWMRPEGAFRKSPKFEAQPGAVATWLRIGELEAEKIETEPFVKENFRLILLKIRALTIEPPQVFEPKMVELAASAGVAVVFVPEIKKCPTSGVARWLTSDKALIQLSLRYKTDDQFWFSFFHEAGHILKDPKKEIFIHNDENDEREVQANRFAANFLIPPEYKEQFPRLRTKASIIQFARSIGIAPGIVVGRLQKEGVLDWKTNLNKLKRRFEWNG